MSMVGYQICRRQLSGFKQYEWEGAAGAAFTYFMAGNGLFIAAAGPLLDAIIPIAEARVRGLPEIEPVYHLHHGLIPARIFDLAFSVMMISPWREVYVAVVWDGQQYSLWVPEQSGKAAGVEFQTVAGAILDLHSHPGMAARFSPVDDRDEQGLRIYGVVGRGLELRLRVGVYGYHYEISPGEVFDRLPDMLLPGEFK